MHKELHTIKIISNYLFDKKIITNKTDNIDNIYSFFKYLSEPKTSIKFNSLYILNYIKQYIVDEEVAKRKTSARVFEDLIAIIFNGEVTDSHIRKNILTDVPEYFKLAKDKISSNKREKVDLLFNNNYGISVKTLIESNTEINLGAFEKKVLFDGFNVSEYLTERKTSDDMGLGSIPRLNKLLQKITDNGNYKEFCTRFINMFEYIFQDDMILAIKGNNKIDLYLFKGIEFTKLITNKANKISSLLSVVNRWEGNSIRINRKEIVKSCNKKITLDLSILDKTIIKLINNLDHKLHKTYVEYFNIENNVNLKPILLNEIDNLFIEFDNNFKSLI